MNPVFLDFHIHTSDDPDNLSDSYDVDALKSKIEEIADGSEFLISFSDHNTINKAVYLDAAKKIDHLLLGVELHIRNYSNADPYHCHILFNNEIDEDTIDKINGILDELYPQKVVNKDDKSIPSLEGLTKKFDEYDFVLLPHGGQNHSTFDKSIPKGVQFDTTMERSIYYNHFEGFTARNNTGLERTSEYFKKLGIDEFINLVTTTDNYNPQKYPACKAGREASDFIPTWMLASPTFDGLRLSLSESSRLKYGKKPNSWAECILDAKLKDDEIDIDVKFTSGLNVVIGDSSSGKSLLIDSMHRKITNGFDGSLYQTHYNVADIQVTNPSEQHPYYFDQNYISKICDPKDNENKIEDIPILKRVFPSDKNEKEKISEGLSKLTSQLSSLVDSVIKIEALNEELTRIPKLSHLITTDDIRRNPLKRLIPKGATTKTIEYSEAKRDKDFKALDRIEKFLSNNPFVEHDKTLVDKLKEELELAYEASELEYSIREIIKKFQCEIETNYEGEDSENATKKGQFNDLLDCILNYKIEKEIFEQSLKSISEFKTEAETYKIKSMEHTLYIENEFKLTKEKFIEVINGMLIAKSQIEKFSDVSPESLFFSNFSKSSPKIADYSDFERRVNFKFQEMNKKKYKIITKDKKNFDELSPGWKTSVILDLILGWEGDNAPLIIDQPEDNLAVNYINSALMESIKKCKPKKQIIFVSHSATIPILGDAQNVIFCKNTDNKIEIRSSPLEGKINNEKVVDLIAKITDGGKASVKKRFKKYNLKNYRQDDEITF